MADDGERIQILNEIEDARRDLEQLLQETSVYEAYYEQKFVEDDEKTKKKSGKLKNSRTPPARLNPNQKYEVANFVNETLGAAIDAKRKTSEKMVGTLRAVLEETEMRIGDLKRDAFEFKRDVVVGAENPRTGKIMSEKVLKYFDSKFEHRDVIIDKLRLKNTTLRANITKAETQLSQKEEVGEVLHYIDFHQLQIENKQFVAKIEERNDELLLVKLGTGNTIKALNEEKSKLNESLQALEYSQDEVNSKQDQLTALKEENDEAVRNIKSERKAQDRLRQSIQDAVAMPDIADYIQQKKLMYECEAEMVNWKKRIEISEMHATNTKRTMNQSAGIFKNTKGSTFKVSQSVNF